MLDRRHHSDIIARLHARESLRKIALVYDLTHEGVRLIGLRHGVRANGVSERESSWSDQQVSFLKRHYKRPQWSAQRIADALGRTRNEIIGKAYRLGLTRAA